MKIDRIYIACFRHDIRFTRILVASIREFYPRIPIFLIKDLFYGHFDTAEIEQHWSVSVAAFERSVFGWGFSKLEPLFSPERQRFLVLDSDTLFVGPILDRLETYSEDFLVVEENPTEAFVKSHYFDLDKLQALEPEFRFPGYSFNTGQWVGTSGLFQREELARWVDWASPPSVRHPEIFKLGEQGLLNYFLMSAAAQGRISLRRSPFMEVGDNPAVRQLELANLHASGPFVIHWCGLKKPRLRAMPRSDLLLHFERKYYRRINGGMPRGHARNARDYAIETARRAARALLRKK